jgi:hypothetical protein
MSDLTLRDHEVAGDLATDIAGQYLFEADARRAGIVFERELTGGVLTYRFTVGIPGSTEEREVQVELSPGSSQPAVHADGPVCLRHRWSNGSLCMWDPDGPRAERWVTGDGLAALAAHVQVHLFCESLCRAGQAWAKTEMAGMHPRKKTCPSCTGSGR